jgi:molybdate transport system substrate-binding protein
MKRDIWQFLCIYFSLFLWGCTHRETSGTDKILHIAVAANMQFAMREIAAGFEQRGMGKVALMIGSSGKLTNQIHNGAPFHLFVSADTTFTRKLIRAGKGVPNSYIYAIGTLVLWTYKPEFKGKQLFRLLEEEAVTKISLPNPITAPYGFQAKKALEKAGIWDKVSSKIVMGESIAQSTQYVYDGVCELGFTAKSVLFAPELKHVGFWQEVPSFLYEPIYQEIIMTKWGEAQDKKQSESFLEFMKSKEVKGILRSHGYQLPEKE